MNINELKTLVLKSGGNARAANDAAKAYQQGVLSSADIQRKYGGGQTNVSTKPPAVTTPPTPKTPAPTTSKPATVTTAQPTTPDVTTEVKETRTTTPTEVTTTQPQVAPVQPAQPTQTQQQFQQSSQQRLAELQASTPVRTQDLEAAIRKNPEREAYLRQLDEQYRQGAFNNVEYWKRLGQLEQPIEVQPIVEQAPSGQFILDEAKAALPTQVSTVEAPTTGAGVMESTILPGGESADQLAEYEAMVNGTSKDIAATYGDDDINTFLNTNLNAYQKLADDLSAVVNAQVTNIEAGTQAMIDNLNKRITFYEQDRQLSLDRMNSQSTVLMDIAAQIKDNQLRKNELEANRTAAQYDQRLSIMQENQGRYLGYLQGKFEAAGMNDSSAGMQLIGKYLAAGEMAITEVQREAQYAREAYLARGDEILNTYFSQAYQVESNRMEAEAQLNRDTFDRINQIEQSIISTDMEKNAQILQAYGNLATQKADLRSKAFNEIVQVANVNLNEAKFAHQVTQDALAQQNFEQQFNYNVLQAERQFGFDFEKFQEDTRRFDLNYALQEQAAAFDQVRNAQAMEIAMGDYNMRLDEYSQSRNMNDYNKTMDLVEKGLLSPEALTQYMTTGDVITNAVYVGQEEVLDLGGVITDVINKVKDGGMPSVYQCVQFVRDIIPDLPYGLNSLQDKMRILFEENKQGAIPAPLPGATVVLDYKSASDAGKNASQYPGHVAIVTSVDTQNRTFTISEFNKKAGQYSTDTISMDNPKIKGYWMSPKIKPKSAASATALTDPDKIASTEISLSKDFRTANKVFLDVRDAYNRVDAAIDKIDFDKKQATASAAGDLSLIFNYMKMLDPGSVVREGEFANAQNSAGVPDQISAKYNQLLSGQRLTADQRFDFYTQAQKLYQSKLQDYNAETDKLKYQAERYGLDINAIMPSISVGNETASFIDSLGY